MLMVVTDLSGACLAGEARGMGQRPTIKKTIA